jgi:cytoskeleton protein RodZ
MPENRLPKTPIVLMSLAVIAGIYAGWSYLNRSSRTVVDPVAEVPSELRARTVEAPMAGEESAAAEPGAAVRPSENVAAARPEPDAASGAAPEPQAALPGMTGDAATLPALPTPTPTPGSMAAPEPGPSVAGRAPLAATPAPDALAMQPAAGGPPGGETGQRALAGPPALAQPGVPPRTDQGVGQPRPSAAGVAPQPSAPDALALADPTAGGAPQVYERGHADARVILRAREEAWVQVSSRTGDYTFTRTLARGEAVMVPNRADLELWTGNAKGLEIIVDGTPVPALAGGGMVRRHVSLDPERLLQAARQPR